ncbi:MAG TPA: SBBP repeat-containing protein [Candidatus Binataceae bacterium]|nr:SBBP repeat-containing protein [Candidatus Binataceae bacterium]
MSTKLIETISKRAGAITLAILLASPAFAAAPVVNPQISPTSISFGRVNVGSVSVARTVLVINPNPVPMILQPLTPSGPFEVGLDSCAAPLAAKGRCQFQVTFNPTGTAQQSGTTVRGGVTVVTVPQRSPQMIALTGIAVGLASPVTPARTPAPTFVRTLTPTKTPTPAPTRSPTSTARATTTPTPTQAPTATAVGTPIAAIYVTNPYDNAVTAYSLGTSGNQPPISPVTALAETAGIPAGVVRDANGFLYVTDAPANMVTIYASDANGQAQPVGALVGPATRLNWPDAIALDSAGNIYVANRLGGGSVTIFSSGSNGNAAPIATLKGAVTGLAFPQGIAVDSSAKIYVANDGSYGGAVDSITVYSAGSTGNAAPIATIGGVATMLAAPGGIAVDSSENIYVANNIGGPNQNGSVTVYGAGSYGNAAPVATITAGAGTADLTQLFDTYAVALDSNRNIYVANGEGDSVTVYPAGANGNFAPTTVIAGIDTGLSIAGGIGVDSHGNIFVANLGGGSNGTGSVTAYLAGSNGDSEPMVMIADTVKTGLSLPEGIAVDAGGAIYVANAHGGPTRNGSVTKYPAGTVANVAPVATIAGSATKLNMPFGVAVDSSGKLYVTNEVAAGSVNVYSAAANGNVAPATTIAGPNTGLAYPNGIAVDSAGSIYVANYGLLVTGASSSNRITMYQAGASGNATPFATISGPSTGLVAPYGIAVDSSGNIYVTNAGVAGAVEVFAAGSTGNTAPIATIGGAATGLTSPWSIALDSDANIYVANETGFGITMYPAGSNGNVTPAAVIGGPLTEISAPQGIAIMP